MLVASPVYSASPRFGFRGGRPLGIDAEIYSRHNLWCFHWRKKNIKPVLPMMEWVNSHPFVQLPLQLPPPPPLSLSSSCQLPTFQVYLCVVGDQEGREVQSWGHWLTHIKVFVFVSNESKSGWEHFQRKLSRKTRHRTVKRLNETPKKVLLEFD